MGTQKYKSLLPTIQHKKKMKKEKKSEYQKERGGHGWNGRCCFPLPPPPLPIRLGMLHTHLFIALSAISFILLLLLIPPLLLLPRLRPTELAPLSSAIFVAVLLRFNW